MHTLLSLPRQASYEKLLYWANGFLAASAAVLLATVLMCYPFEQWFSLPQLIVGHLSVLASATMVKISYVGRCIALYALKREVR